MAKQKRIVCYAINGAGMGHVTRLLSVARWIRRYGALLDEKPPEILFLTSSDASDILADAGFAAFKIPSKTIARKTELNKLEYRRLAKHFIWNTIGVFSPDLLVVDTFPSGSFDELFQVLDGPFKKSFIYRKVKPEYAARPTFRSAMRMYDSVVAPHAPNQASNGKYSQVDKRIQFSGEVTQFEREDFLDVEAARKELAVADSHRLVYLSAGGGGDPDAEQQIQSLVKAMGRLEKVHLLVGAGRLYRGRRISGNNLTWYDGPAVGKYFGAVDAAVSAAGYNTFHELIFAGVPTAFFAQEKVADDQSERIDSASQAGACLRIEDWNNEEDVCETVIRLLNNSHATPIKEACQNYFPRNGASHCALSLLRPLYDETRLEWAQQLLSPRLAARLESLGNSASCIAEWLGPLMPRDRIQSAASHAGLESLLGQLSESASDEVQRVLSNQHEWSDHARFESHLIELLDSIDKFENADQVGLSRESLKTILAMMKKQPLDCGQANGFADEIDCNWTRWICDIIQGVARVLELPSIAGDATVAAEAVRLARVFPKIVDADVSEAFQLFESYFQKRADDGVPIHESSQALQLLKMTQSRITKEFMENSIQALPLSNPI